MNLERILVLAPHTDDGELGSGGTIARMISEGAKVFYAAFSIAEESVPEGLPKNILSNEVKIATAALGIREENLFIYKFPVRRFCYQRQEILEILVTLRKDIEPDRVLLPSGTDIHQDHQVIHNEGLRAFKKCSLQGYELPWNDIKSGYNKFIVLDKNHLNKKVKALSMYKSQNFRAYMKKDFIFSWACMRGTQIGVEFAEVFETIREVAK